MFRVMFRTLTSDRLRETFVVAVRFHLLMVMTFERVANTLLGPVDILGPLFVLAITISYISFAQCELKIHLGLLLKHTHRPRRLIFATSPRGMPIYSLHR